MALDIARRLWRDPEKLVPALLFFAVSSVYFAAIAGIPDGNAGSHYAAVRALVATGHLDIAGFESFTQQSDYAIGIDGALHSDRPPAIALIAAGLYRLGLSGPEPWVIVSSNHDTGNPYVIYAVLASVLTGAATIALFYTTLREHFQTSAAAALLASLALAFGTTMWKYSTTLYNHAPAGMFALLAVHLALRAANRQELPPTNALLLGFSLGAAVLADYMNAILTVLMLIYLGMALGRAFVEAIRDGTNRREWLVSLGAATLGSAVPAVFFLVYNKMLFGGFLQLGIYWVDPVLWSCCTTFAKNFSTPLLDGLQGMLFYGNKNQGIFLLTPVAALTLLGWRSMAKQSRRDFIFIIGTFVVLLLAFSKNATVNPDTDDSRYLTNFLAFWYLPLGVWLDRYALRRESDLARLAVSILFYGLLFLSIRNMFMHIAFSWNYDLRLDTLPYLSTPPQTIATLLATVFPNAGNLPLLWLFETAALVLIWAVWRLAHALPQRFVPHAAIGLGTLVLAGGSILTARMLTPPFPPPGMTPFEAEFATPEGGAIHLRGYRVADWYGNTTPGDPLHLRLYWEAEGSVSEDYSVVVWLETEDGNIWAENTDTLGYATWRERPPDTWRTGEVFQEQYVVTPPGPPDAALMTTAYVALETPSGERLPIAGEEADALVIIALHPATWQ
jgi:hypothetical protein